jgi:2'-5' RNA ligase
LDYTLTKVEFGQLFALIGFVPGALGDYLNLLRQQLVPGCPHKSHVSLLPPRTLGGTPSHLSGILRRRLLSIQPCRVGLGEVEVFPATGVIYLGIESGGDDLRRIHGLLSQDEFDFDETYPFHPHITLAQDFPLAQSDELAERACSLWKTWDGERSFLLDRVSFVRGVDLNDWETVSKHDLNHTSRLRIV